MILTELCGDIGATVVTGSTDRELGGVYAGDLLSRAMSHITEGDLWITIMTNANVIAVASLTGASAVLLAEGVTLLPDALSAAEENGITVLSSDDTVYDLCRKVGDYLR